MKEILNNYRFGVNTQVLFRGKWHYITEVWLEEEKIGIETGHLLDWMEIDDIRENTKSTS